MVTGLFFVSTPGVSYDRAGVGFKLMAGIGETIGKGD